MNDTNSHRLDPLANLDFAVLLDEGPEEIGPPCYAFRATVSLEDKLQSQLNGAIAAGTEHRIERSVVRRGAATTERASLRWIGSGSLSITAGCSIGLCEIGVVKDVERLDAELRLHSLSQFEAFA